MPELANSELEQVKNTFFPTTVARVEKAKSMDLRFVHYTSAEAALGILTNREVWMRNAMTMNDSTEIEYGFNCLKNAYEGDAGKLFKTVLEENFPGCTAQLEASFNAWLPGFRRDTYLTCVSEHDQSEDQLGRLSMWRAYGGRSAVALVLKGAPFHNESNVLKAYTSPVAYLNSDTFSKQFMDVAERMRNASDLLLKLGRDRVFQLSFHMLRFSVLCTKHIGFHEEKEWRVIYSPTVEQSDKIQTAVATINGTPQKIHKIPLQNVPDQGLIGMEIPEIIDRIIIGPCQFPHAIYTAFHHLLKEAKVEHPEDMLVISEIPLR